MIFWDFLIFFSISSINVHQIAQIDGLTISDCRSFQGLSTGLNMSSSRLIGCSFMPGGWIIDGSSMDHRWIIDRSSIDHRYMTIDIIVIIMIIISNMIIIMIINMLIINRSNVNFIHGCIITGVNNIYVIIIMASPLL